MGESGGQPASVRVTGTGLANRSRTGQVLIDRGGQLLVALRAFRPGHSDLEPDGGKSGPHAVIEAEEPADIEVALYPHAERVEADAYNIT